MLLAAVGLSHLCDLLVGGLGPQLGQGDESAVPHAGLLGLLHG